MKTQEVAKRGILDVIMCVNGVFVAIELKRAKSEKPDELQRWNMKKIISSGGVALLAYPENWDEVFIRIKNIAYEGKDAPSLV